MSTVRLKPVFHIRRREIPRCRSKSKPLFRSTSFTNRYSSNNYVFSDARIFCNFRPPRTSPSHSVSAVSTDTTILEPFQSADVSSKDTFPVKLTEMLEGKISVRLDQVKHSSNWELRVGCNLPGKWVLHWGVSHVDDVGCEWDKPPSNMIPPGSISIKDHAIETPMKKSSLSSAERDTFYEVKIDLKPCKGISSINFVVKDEETGAWYQHKGRDFKVPLVDYIKDDANTMGPKRGFNFWPGALGQLSNILLGTDTNKGQENSGESRDSKEENGQLDGFYIELPIAKKIWVNKSVSVSIRNCSEMAKNLIYLETDIPGEIVLHWGVCRDEKRKWEVPPAPHPPETVAFKDRALRTPLQPREDGNGSSIIITLEEGFSGFVFVLRLDENTWLNYIGNDFYLPLSSSSSLRVKNIDDESKGVHVEETEEANQTNSFSGFADGIIKDLKNLVSDISSEKNQKVKSKEAQGNILQEIERLAAEAYNIFRNSVPTFSEEPPVETKAAVEVKDKRLPAKICSGTGTGYEILCQGFNWESHKSGRWYVELKQKAEELASLGFTVIWLPPPTESVSPEGYMPKDLYNLNSRYGSIDELKDLVKRFHEVGISVLGDAVLNHRCAQYQNQNGVWNIFGGRLNWDDRAVVADDPHFQGKGNKSSGDNFHAAPNIDHSQEFVRTDLKEWLCWLRKEIGYDGWRLDFARGFWGGYVKDYMEASEPYFAVGEYWDSLSYTYGEMDHNQDAHRQRIIDWINATNGTAGAFDVTTKGILHSALERCEYWRLTDRKGKPPGAIGWWPSRAVTFIENHDTGSTQGHWRFPSGKEMQGYAYILTHPGTPSVFFDHIFSHYRTEIGSLISLRKRNKIHCRSTVQILKAERDVYAAVIDEKLAMKIGPGHFEPPSRSSGRWSLACEGRDYKLWEAS
ncbi:alpha-amylase 3, chloroplastic-like [Neltuma alba]|uniref:alpha-amylase 3, chloroplastic-like n=1 Tax=Neltuma alba TaxID=207710 RepID=UPI0010A49A89|nr:alpha-amylase 3, chloroplastic-like [Prosopis alba]